MSERERLEAEAAQAEIAQIEEEDRIEGERTLMKATAQYERTLTDLAKLRRDVLFKDRDPDYVYGVHPSEYAWMVSTRGCPKT